MEAAWREIQTKGFVVVRSFLTPAELKILCEVDPATLPAPNTMYPGVKVMPGPVADQFREKLTAAAAAVSASSDVRVDTLTGAAYFSMDFADGFNSDTWHQDHESYYEYQDHYDYLNFWIPIKKPDPARSNLNVIPFDVLEERAPEVFASRKGKGACKIPDNEDNRVIYDYDRGKVRVLPFSINDLSVTPELEAGDLLLLRGDLIHKTQDTATKRTAVSFRMVNSKHVLRRRELTRMNWRKFVELSSNKNRYRLWSECFEVAKKNELTIAEFQELKKRISKSSGASHGAPNMGSWPSYLSCIARNWLADH